MEKCYKNYGWKSVSSSECTCVRECIQATHSCCENKEILNRNDKQIGILFINSKIIRLVMYSHACPYIHYVSWIMDKEGVNITQIC